MDETNNPSRFSVWAKFRDYCDSVGISAANRNRDLVRAGFMDGWQSHLSDPAHRWDRIYVDAYTAGCAARAELKEALQCPK